ncbi:hypothetical protein E4U50_000901 [Claviceps purpurea]|nr:hypothetical protein E4U50_000901 [Claviceps purpurea]
MAPTPSVDDSKIHDSKIHDSKIHDAKIHENVRSRDLAPQNEDRHEFSRGHEHRPTLKHPRWNPRFWTRKVWIGFAAINMMATVLVVSAAVARTREGSSYPDYSPLTYALKDTYAGESFFDHFNYKTGDDPTHGFVHYVPREEALFRNLTYATPSTAVLRVDTAVGPNSKPDASTGRFSARIESKKTYDGGLFIFDVKHTPYACGVWPALWLTDPFHWPEHGEIDVLESINEGNDGNAMTLHSTDGCTMSVERKQTNPSLHDDCHHKAYKNAGCGVKEPDATFGAAINDAGGSIMAVEWRTAGIRMWRFARDAIPYDITTKKPYPAGWGAASADFPSTECDIGAHFKNHSIVVNIDLCGDLVSENWEQSGCPSTCTDLVTNQPDLFGTAFWEFGSFEVYQKS